jgi:hypothetical protein
MQSVGEAVANMGEKLVGGVNGLVQSKSNEPSSLQSHKGPASDDSSTTTTTTTTPKNDALTLLEKRRAKNKKAWESLYRKPSTDSQTFHQVYDFDQLSRYEGDSDAWKNALENRRNQARNSAKPYELFDYAPSAADRALVLHKLFGQTPYLVESNQVEWEENWRRVPIFASEKWYASSPLKVLTERLSLSDFSKNFTPSTLAQPRSKLIESPSPNPGRNRTPVELEKLRLYIEKNEVAEMMRSDGRELSIKGFLKILEDPQLTDTIRYRPQGASHWNWRVPSALDKNVAIHIGSQERGYVPSSFLREFVVV